MVVRVESVTKMIFLLAACLAPPRMARADVMLTDVSYTQAFSNGTATEQSEAGTNSTCCETIFMAHGALSAHPLYYNTSQTNLSVDLTPGTYTFSGYFATTQPASYGNVSLFFGESGTPGMTVQSATTNSLAGVPAYSADANTTLGLTSPWWLPGANSLTYDNGTSRATLSNFVLAANPLLTSVGAPAVGSNALAWDGSYNIGTQFTLTVTNDAAVTEPPNLLFAPALALLMLYRAGGRSQLALSVAPTSRTIRAGQSVAACNRIVEDAESRYF